MEYIKSMLTRLLKNLNNVRDIYFLFIYEYNIKDSLITNML
jgi:hypothetical protein